MRAAGFRKLVAEGIKFRTAEPQQPRKMLGGFSANFSVGLPTTGAGAAGGATGANVKKRKAPATAASAEAASKKQALAAPVGVSSSQQFVGYGAPSTLQLRGLHEASATEAAGSVDYDIAEPEEEEAEEAAEAAVAAAGGRF
jgi:hypothetical protein